MAAINTNKALASISNNIRVVLSFINVDLVKLKIIKIIGIFIIAPIVLLIRIAPNFAITISTAEKLDNNNSNVPSSISCLKIMLAKPTKDNGI